MQGLRSTWSQSTQGTQSSTSLLKTSPAPITSNGSTRHHRAVPHQQCVRRAIIAHQKGKLADDLLDYVTAGPKMRKWYGQEERSTGEEPPRPEQDQEPEQDSSSGNAVLVTDADSAVGEQVVLQLILAGAEIKILVRDTVAAKTSYGPYVTPVSIDTSNGPVLARVLRDCASVVCLGRPRALAQAAQQAEVEHVVLLSAVDSKQGGFLSSFFDRELSELKGDGREQAMRGVNHTILRVPGVSNAPGGRASIQLLPAGPTSSAAAPSSDPVSREDLARVVVQALLNPPQEPRTLQIVSKPGSPPDWAALF